LTAHRYRLAPGLEVVRQGDDRFQLRSDFTALNLSGETAAELVEKVFVPLQRQSLTFDEIAERLPGYRPESLGVQIESFVRAGVLVLERETEDAGNPTFDAFLDEIGVGAAATKARLAEATVAIFGLEAHGAHVAQLLAEMGVGHLVLADPFPFETGHFSLTPVRDPQVVGLSRENAVARTIARAGLDTTIAGQSPFDRDRVRALADECDLLIVCWDRGFLAAHHWANEAALVLGVPALFSDVRATMTYAGPLFLPERSACWMCYRMRAIAAEEDFDIAMAYEEHFDRKRQPTLVERPLLPGLAQHLASTLALEALRYLIRLGQPTLVDKVAAYDGLAGATQVHPVLVKPFCPACSKKKPRHHPFGDELLETSSRVGTPLEELAGVLVSDHSGIVTHFGPASRDATEPPRPLVWRARISNHLFFSKVEPSHHACSGKGMTRAAAWRSCLGEAVERYSAGVWRPDEVVLSRRSDLDGRSLDPRELVLFRPEQYADLQYAQYTDETEMRWIRGRSLVHEDEVWLPAIAVFMEYEVHSQEEFLVPITSNGLAAGPTLADAVLSAIYEVVERDAVLIAWHNQLPGRRYDAATHPDADVRQLAKLYARRGVELALFELPADHPIAVFVAIAFQRGGFGGPYATVGMGANVDPNAAARSAALEVGQVRPTFRERARTLDAARIAELRTNPSGVKSLEDHALLYADPLMADAFAFLEGERGQWRPSAPSTTADALRAVLDHFRAASQDVLYVNLTPRDLEPLGLFTVRAILPGFQPIWFGHGERRLGGPRLYELPFRLGLRDQPATFESLNPLPHPIA
jgi:ribosomal protein S12 methylthiotransferase accessory factor